VGAEGKIKTIQTIYEAFGRGDVAAITDAVTDDVDWATEASGKGAPWYGPHRGTAGVKDFFAAFGSTMEVQEFTPTTFAGTENEVLTVVRCVATPRTTGRQVTMDLHHYFRFRGDKIEYYRGTEDTAQVSAALEA
jgi:uncharacterized protein